MRSEDLVIVLGAARSGTKLVRNVLAAGSAVRCVPYDINYVWRFGQERAPDDVLDPSDAPPGLAQHVLGRIDRMAPGQAPNVVEKTVSNVLRIPYVVTVAPRARYVYLERRGEDVVESTLRNWQEPPQAGRLVEKLRTFPWRSSSRYAFRYAGSALRQLVLRDRVATWGPRYRGIDADVTTRPLVDVCARQWAACTAAFERHRGLLPQVSAVRYEDLATSPAEVAGRLAVELGLDPAPVREAARGQVRSDRIGHAARSGVDLNEIRMAIDRARHDTGDLL